MIDKKRFKGSIVIADPCYFTISEEDWQKCEYGERMDKLGFTDFLMIEYPDDPLVVVNDDNQIIGRIVQDCGRVVVVYLSELEKYNPDYEKDLFSENNRTIIHNFDGEVGYKTVIVENNTDEDDDEYGFIDDEELVIYGNGNISFRSCYEFELE